jgi:hypothetical protein
MSPALAVNRLPLRVARRRATRSDTKIIVRVNRPVFYILRPSQLVAQKKYSKIGERSPSAIISGSGPKKNVFFSYEDQ